MIFRKTKSLTEVEEFIKKFPKGKKSYGLTVDHSGHIISCDTKDSGIIVWLKAKGLSA